MIAQAPIQQKVFLYPANVYVAVHPVCIATLLGTCIAVCLWDPKTKIGGMNHYLLPLWNGVGLASPKYGNIAIEKLVRQLEDKGVERKNIVAKVFGGRANADSGSVAYNIGLRNAKIARELLTDLHIPILAENTGGDHGMNIRFDTATGIVMLKYIKASVK